MGKDLTDLNVQGTPEVVLRCAECGETKPIGGVRIVSTRDLDLPAEPLCEEDFAFAVRFLESDRLRPLGPASHTDEEDGSYWVRRTCPRCGGEGRIKGFRGTCFLCWGHRWTYVCPRNVRQVMRASATFQANRTPDPTREKK